MGAAISLVAVTEVPSSHSFPCPGHACNWTQPLAAGASLEAENLTNTTAALQAAIAERTVAAGLVLPATRLAYGVAKVALQSAVALRHVVAAALAQFAAQQFAATSGTALQAGIAGLTSTAGATVRAARFALADRVAS